MGRIAPGAVSRRAFPFQDIAIITQRLGAFALSSKVMLQEQVADDRMSSSLRKRGGRPRLADAREPSGRISRRISDSQKDFRLGQAIWRDFLLSVERSTGPTRLDLRSILEGSRNAVEPHPILKLVNLGKMETGSFIIALYWVCTDIAIAPGWRKREYLTQVTGFDFCTPQGCLAARRFATEQLGRDCVEMLDDAALRGAFRTDLSILSDWLCALWQAWCSHGANERDR